LSSPSEPTEHDIAVLSQIETGRAHQVADVLDEQQIDVGEPDLVQSAVDHGRVEMAGVAGGDLDCRHALRANAPGIVLGREVAFHDADRYCVRSRRMVASSNDVLPAPAMT
jgi:hypothetical protein